MNKYPRIVADPDHLHGAPRIDGTRIPVELIAAMVAGGTSVEEILTNYYPWITAEDVKQAVEFWKENGHLYERVED